MCEIPQVSTFIVRLTSEPAGSVSGVVERVRNGVKDRFEGREALHRLIDEMLGSEMNGGTRK